MGLSLSLFGLASLPLAFERTCALPEPVPSQLVQAGLSLLSAPNDAARKNAALFFDAAVHYPVLLKCFDACDGLHRLLYPLRHVAQLLQAGGPAELRAERQVRCWRWRVWLAGWPGGCGRNAQGWRAAAAGRTRWRPGRAAQPVPCLSAPAVCRAGAGACPCDCGCACACACVPPSPPRPMCVQVAYHASKGLLQYVRAHLVLHLTSLQRRLRDGQVSARLLGCVVGPCSWGASLEGSLCCPRPLTHADAPHAHCPANGRPTPRSRSRTSPSTRALPPLMS
jgi:hypothetical protein